MEYTGCTLQSAFIYRIYIYTLSACIISWHIHLHHHINSYHFYVFFSRYLLIYITDFKFIYNNIYFHLECTKFVFKFIYIIVLIYISIYMCVVIYFYCVVYLYSRCWFQIKHRKGFTFTVQKHVFLCYILFESILHTTMWNRFVLRQHSG